MTSSTSKVRSNVRIIPRLLGIVLFIISLAFISLPLFVIIKSGVPTQTLLLGMIFTWLGLGFLELTSSSMKTIIIHGDSIVVGTCFGFLKKRYSFDDIDSISSKSFKNKWKTYPGLLMKFQDNRLLHIHEMEFQNFNDLKKVITEKVHRYERLQTKFWTPFTITYFVFGFLILAVLLITYQ